MPKKTELISNEMRIMASHFQVEIAVWDIAIAETKRKIQRIQIREDSGPEHTLALEEALNELENAEAQRSQLTELHERALVGKYKKVIEYIDHLKDDRPKLENLKIGVRSYSIAAVREALISQWAEKKGKT